MHPETGPAVVTNRDIALIGIAVLMAVSCVTVLFGSGTLTYLSRETPVSDPALDYAWGIALAAALGFLVLALPLQPRVRLAVMTVWCAKTAVTLVAMPYYENFYVVLDAFLYYEIPRSPAFSAESLTLGHGTQNLHSLIWLLYHVMPESYHALKVIFSFVGLLAVLLFYRAGAVAVGREDVRILYALALFPSILFWSSILGKEPIALFGIALYAYGAVRWFRSRDLRSLLWVGLGITIAAYVRLWLAPILIVPILVLLAFTVQRLAARLAVVTVFGTVTALSLASLWEHFALESAEDVLLGIDATSQLWARGGSGLVIDYDLRRPSELAAAFPLAAFTALFRPLPGEIPHLFGMLSGLENGLLLLLVALAVKRFRVADLRQPLVLWALLLVLCWTAAYAFVSYQNLGAAVRFRLQILPFLLGLLVYLGRRKHGPLEGRPHGDTPGTQSS